MLLGATSASGLTTGFEAFAFIENYWPYANNYTTEGTFRNGSASYYTSTGNHTLNGVVLEMIFYLELKVRMF